MSPGTFQNWKKLRKAAVSSLAGWGGEVGALGITARSAVPLQDCEARGFGVRLCGVGACSQECQALA